MAHDFKISDEQYAKLAAYAAQRKQTPETLFQEWVRAVTRNVEKPFPSSGVKPTGKEGQAGHKEAPLSGPLFQVAGMFAIGEPGWADKHDEYLAETYLENHADSK